MAKIKFDPAVAAANSRGNSEYIAKEMQISPDERITQIRVDMCVPNPYQYRVFFDASKMAELEESIRINGLLSPIVVRRVGNDFQIVFGERRWRAHKSLGLPLIKAVIREYPEGDLARFAYEENSKRDDPSDLENAMFYRARIDEGISATEVAKTAGIARAQLYNVLSLLDLPEPVIDLLKTSPKILGGAHAAHLKAVFAEAKKGTDFKSAEDCVDEVVSAAVDGMRLLIEGEITQRAFVDKVRIVLAQSQIVSKATAKKEPAESMRFVDGQGRPVGHLKKSLQHFNLKLSSAAVPDHRHEEFEARLAELVQEYTSAQ